MGGDARTTARACSSSSSRGSAGPSSAWGVASTPPGADRRQRRATHSHPPAQSPRRRREQPGGRGLFAGVGFFVAGVRFWVAAQRPAAHAHAGPMQCARRRREHPGRGVVFGRVVARPMLFCLSLHRVCLSRVRRAGAARVFHPLNVSLQGPGGGCSFGQKKTPCTGGRSWTLGRAHEGNGSGPLTVDASHPERGGDGGGLQRSPSSGAGWRRSRGLGWLSSQRSSGAWLNMCCEPKPKRRSWAAKRPHGALRSEPAISTVRSAHLVWPRHIAKGHEVATNLSLSLLKGF